MLGFSKQNNRPQSNIVEQSILTPMTIEHQLDNKNLYPMRKHKVIHPLNEQLKKKDTAIKSKTSQVQKQWIQGGHIDIFDQKIKKKVLEHQENQLKAIQRKKQFIVHSQKQYRDQSVQKHGEIQRLRKIIQQQKKEQRLKDKQFQQKVKQIEKERKQLQLMQRRLMQKGPPVMKQIRKNIEIRKHSQIPVSDRARCHQQIRNVAEEHKQIVNSQMQLKQLMVQRERALRTQPNLNYTPTLIPLLSKASYKLISLNVSALVQILIDELLLQEVELLEQLEQEQNIQRKKSHEKKVLTDYCEELENFVSEVQIIEGRVGKYGRLQLEHYPKYYKEEEQITHISQFKWIEIELDQSLIESMYQQKEEFQKITKYEDAYKVSIITMLDSLTEELLIESVQKLAQQLQKGSEDLVRVVFQNELK